MSSMTDHKTVFFYTVCLYHYSISALREICRAATDDFVQYLNKNESKFIHFHCLLNKTDPEVTGAHLVHDPLAARYHR